MLQTPGLSPDEIVHIKAVITDITNRINSTKGNNVPDIKATLKDIKTRLPTSGLSGQEITNMGNMLADIDKKLAMPGLPAEEITGIKGMLDGLAKRVTNKNTSTVPPSNSKPVVKYDDNEQDADE
jgi:hypothetical protein